MDAVSDVIWNERPSLRRPILIAAFGGWNDAGDAASAAVDFIGARFEPREVARIDPAWLARERERIGNWSFNQEYLCEFLEGDDAFFTLADIAAAQQVHGHARSSTRAVVVGELGRDPQHAGAVSRARTPRCHLLAGPSGLPLVRAEVHRVVRVKVDEHAISGRS